MSFIIDPVDSPYRVPFDGSFRVAKAASTPGEEMAKAGKKAHKKALKNTVERMSELQQAMYAHDRWSLLLVFQAMDAAGKDGTIRRVMTGLNPAGCQVSSFKKPSSEELDHDFLWRVHKRLPERGRIGIFNRSHYEDVLVVRVHPGYLEGHRLPRDPSPETVFEGRYASIRDWEHHLARSGTVVLKFWLNVSYEEQRGRFLDRIAEPESRWKFNAGDVAERRRWKDYMGAYEKALNETSRPWAPWFSIPADDKPYMRRTVADIIVSTMERMAPTFPNVDKDGAEEMQRLAKELAND